MDEIVEYIKSIGFADKGGWYEREDDNVWDTLTFNHYRNGFHKLERFYFNGGRNHTLMFHTLQQLKDNLN